MMNILGYTSPKDWLQSLLKTNKNYKMNIIIAFAFTASLILQINFVERWIWSPAWTLIILTVVLVLDFVLAVTSSKVRKNESFKTQKATKFAVSLLSYWITISLAYNLAPMMHALGVGGAEVWNYFGKAYFFFILFLNMVSVLKHMSDLNYLPKAVAAFFIKYIDTHKNSVLKPENKQDSKNEGGPNE